MPQFRYRALDAQGKVVTGEVEASHAQALAAQLSRSGLTMLRATELKSKSKRVSRIDRREQIVMFFQLEMLLRSGVPMLTALADLRDSAQEPGIRNISAALYERINNGDSVSQAMSAYPGVFSESTLNLIRCGEASGELPAVLSELLRSLKWTDELTAKAKKVVSYPLFVAVVIGAVVMFLMMFLVPQMTEFLKNMKQEMPAHTKALIATSDFIKSYWWAILGTPIVSGVILHITAKKNKNVRRMVHAALLKVPLIGSIYHKIAMARIADTLVLMYKSGIPLIDAIGFCTTASGSLVIQESILRVQQKVSQGGGLADSFASEPLFPPLVVRMLRVSESTGRLEGALANVNYFYNRDINESISRVESLIEPAMTVSLAVVLGWIMLSVMGPIYDSIAALKI
jgi:type IV pilus assembly protein PilC